LDQGEHILGAALRVMDKVGYEAAGLRDIAEEAGVALGSIYRYFPEGKRQLLQAMTERLAEARRACDLPRPGNKASQLEAYLAATIGFWDRHRPLARVLATAAVFEDSVAAALRAEVLRPWLADLRKAFADGDCADPVAAAKLVQSQILYNAVWAPALAERVPAARLAGSLVQLIRTARPSRRT
jgi:AcrR family transcriptional regulator